MSLTKTLFDRDVEQLVLCRDPDVGLSSVIAVHDTSLGPALGGIRMRAYPDPDAAVRDAIDLAEAMTYKAALAGLDLGGGKSVINADPTSPNRDELLAAHARYIASLGGRYIPAVDMGTTVADLELVGSYVPTVSSQRRDPSYFTARGVVSSIRAAVEATDGSDLCGVRVAVQGLGNVGRHVATVLAEAGAVLTVADIDPMRAQAVHDSLGADAVEVDEVLAADVDVVCPCAGGAVITEPVLDRLKARYVLGAANNLLADPALAVQLSQRGVVHVPDFVSNAGGLIACEAEVKGDDSRLLEQVDAIGDTTRAVLHTMRDTGNDGLSVAIDLAFARIAARRSSRPHFATP